MSSPVKTTPVTQQNVVMPKTPTQGGAIPMFRQQNVVTPKWQSPIMQGLNSGALQQQNAKPYQSKEALEKHVKDVKPQTVAQRVGNTLKGATKTYGAGVTNAVGLAQTGSGLQRRGEAEKEIALWDQDIKAQRDVLADPSSTASERDTARNVITALEAKKAAYLQAYGEGGEVERTAGNIYKAADRLADSGAKDISKAKRDLGGAGRLAVDVGVAGAQMGMDAALGLLTGGSALPAMFARSAGGSAQEARRAGATHEQQVNYGLASGALSVATEKIGNAAGPFRKMFGKGFLDDVIERTMGNLTKSTAGKLVLSFLEEGGEEAIEDLIQPALQTIYNGKTLGGSYSDLEASEILNDFLVGGILGGLGGGVEAAANRFARFNNSLGESGRKAIRGSYQEGKDTAEHVKDFIPAYNAGVEGKANPNPTNETAYAGYVAGQNDAKAEARKKTFAQESDGGSGLVYDDYVSREMDNATADEINTVAKALGVRVRMADVVRGGTANGVIEGNEIRIAKDAQDPVMQVVGHEWTHRVQELAPEQYTAFRDAIMEDPDVAEAANILHEQYNRMGVEISTDEAMDEAAANYAGEMIANTDVLNEFIRRHSEDRTLLEKLRDAIREIVGKLTGKAKQQAQTAEGLLQQAFEAAAQNSKNAATEGGKAKFEIKTLDDGRSYVKADRQVLEGDDPKQWGVQLQNYINSEIRKGNDIVLPTTDGGLVRLTERSAYKLADNKSTDLKTHQKTQLSDEAYRLKETAASHIDEIILTGEFSHNMEDIGGVHQNDIGEDGFNSYVSYFEDSDGQYYRVSFVSALNGNEETAYSIGNIQKRKKPTTGNGSSTRESGALNGGRLSGNSVLQNEGNVNRVDSSAREGDDIKYDDARYSLRVTDKDTLDYLDGQKTVKTYKTMQLVDGKLYPPMAARVEGKYEDASELGAWEMAVERPDLVKNGKFKLDKGKGQGSLEAAYNPYMHSSNLVINDQFSGAYARNNLVTVECEVPVSEDTSGYHAEGAKDSTGWHSWHTGTVAGQVRKAKGIERKVFLSRWIKPVRILSDAEVAGMYKELLGGTDIAVPDNVVTPGLLAELKKAGVPISESGRLTKENGKKRYSLKEDSEGRELTEQQQEYFKDSKAVDGEGRLLTLYHGTGTKFTVFDKAHIGENFADRGSDLGFYFSPYIEDATGYAREATGYKGKGEIMQVYLNLKNPLVIEDEGWGSAIGQADIRHVDLKRWAQEGGHDGIIVKSTDIEMDDNGTPDAVYIAFSPEQVKNVTNKTPTRNPDIRYSLKEYTDEEKKQHRKDADEYFGHTYKWSETGYILTNGKKLDFSGRHEGGPGGYRTVDHRDIRDALGDDYGGSDYSGSMVQFMSEGNIRISPESGGINLSVMPTKNQLDSLSDFISHNRGEVILDLDTPDGQTVSSTEYPRGTHANKVLADIKAYFEDGTTPQVSSLAQFLSLKGTENAQEIAALKRENETLRERVDYWKRQTRRSDGVRTDSKSVEKAAKELTHRYGAEIDGNEIAGDLASLYDYIARGGDETGELTYTEARSRADSIAQRIAESAIAKDDEAYREYSELRKYLKDTKITLSAEDAAGITDYADFRRSLFGKVNLGKGEHTNVDQVYSELAESYPEFFSETRENNVSDQISRIAEVANELYSVSEYNPFEGYMGQAVSAISNDIIDRFFDLPQAKKTFADVQAEKLDAAKAAGRKAAADAKLAGQMAQGRTDAVKLRHTQEALQKARTQQAEKLDALRNRYREKDATRREGQKRRELRAKITRHAKDLSKKLLRPTDTKHIPENMRSAVAAVLNSINQESAYTVDESGKHVYDGSGTPTQRTQAFEALRDQYQDILSGREKDGDDLVIDPSLLGTDGKDGLLGQVIGMKDKRLSELTREELGTVWKTIRAVEKSVSTAGKVLSKSKFETTKQMADAFKADVSTRRKKLGNNTTISLETPYTFFAHYGETGKSIYRMLRNAQDSQELMARDIAEKTRKVLVDELGEEGFKDIAGKAIHGDLKGALRDARGSAIGKWEAETHDITVANGGKLTLTTPQIMELYLLSKRKQALGHLLGGGVIQPEIKSAETGRTKVPRGTQQVFLTDGDIERITGKLTDEQKRVADGLQELTATTLAKYGNEASMQAYGYRKFTEKNYWPIKSAKETLHSNLEKDSGNVRSIKNIGMAQQVTPNANNAVELRSVFDTFADHASDMIDYAAWLAPMEDANRFFNFQYRNDAGNKTGVSVKGLLDEKGGKGAQQYWQKLMGDIQNGIGTKDFEPIRDKIMVKATGNFKGASVGANIRVVIQQPTAFFRAAAVLDPKDMAKGMAGGVTKGSGWEKALEHSPIAMRKDVGSFDISSPYTLKDRFYGKEGVTNKLNALAGAAAGKADAATWGKLWNACEWQVKREKPDVRAGSNEFYSAVNDVFSDMIDQTQVVDGILQRSNIMRGKGDLSQQATAFMGEPIMSLNVLLRSYDNFRYEENPAKRSKALKTLGRAATALVVTDVVNALAQSIVDGLRDDDRDKDYWEKFFSAFTGVEGDEKNALELIGNVVLNGNVGSNLNLLTKIPVVKDTLSLFQGYDVSRPDMESIAGLVSAASIFIKSIGGNGVQTRKEAMLTLLAQASKIFSLPVSNIKRDLMATLRTIAQASGSLGFQYEVEKFSYNLANSGNRSRFIGILYDALEQGDYATYEHVRRDLMEHMGIDGESIQSSLKTRYNKKTESEANYSFPQKSLDLLGIRGKYAYDSGEDEEKFSAADLNASSYSKYETQKGEAYRAQADKATRSGAFSRLSDEGKDKALGYVESYAEAVALKENSGGQYEITTKWIQNAQEAQKQYRIAPGVFAACKAAASECEMLKDKDGDSIDYSKGLQIMEMLFRSGLNEQQRTAMYEYLDVPKKIRHWNRARVDEQLAIMRKKAA